VTLADSECSEDGCIKPVHSRLGLCKSHYGKERWARIRPSTKPLYPRNKPVGPERLCDKSGCTQPHAARGMCKAHYQAWRYASGLSPYVPNSDATANRNAEGTLRRGAMLRAPLKSPFRVLARSCPNCGDLMTTPDHLIRRGSGPIPPCRVCVKTKGLIYLASPGVREQIQSSRRTHDYSEQTATLDAASNRYKEWTGPELEVAARSDLTRKEVAAMLGRTYFAVKAQRYLLNHDPRKDRLAGISGTPKVVTPPLREARQ